MSSSLLFRPGALSRGQIIEVIDEHSILKNVQKKNIDGSSFDLTLSEDCRTLTHAVKPRKDESYSTVFNDARKEKPNFRGEFHLKQNNIYVFRLRETVSFKGYKKFYGRATGKSSLGRLDLLVRLVAEVEDADCYDYVPDTQAGSPLYVEIVPITFDIIVKEGFAISQLRLFVGDPELNKISDRRLEKIYKQDLLRQEDGSLFSEEDKFSKRLTVNLTSVKGGHCAFGAKKDGTEPINLPELEKELGKAKESKTYEPKLLEPKDYWEQLNPDGESLRLESERFYILRSCERLYLPRHVCVGCEAVKEELGELRIHYAGFAHPCFGRNRNDEKGTPLIFEVRGHNFDTCLRHGEALAALEFFQMSSETEVDNGPKTKYDAQELQLSKYFEDWK